jgi:hypothetical protein
MTLSTYHILKKRGTDFEWMDAAEDIDSAKKRVQELSEGGNTEFVVFNERSRWSQASTVFPFQLDLLQSKNDTLKCLTIDPRSRERLSSV